MTSPNTPNEKRICIGKVTSAHGVKGLVKIMPYCEDINLLEGKCFTEESGDKTLNITLKNSMGKHILAQIEGINTREEAQKIKCSLYVPRETLPDIANDDEYYIEDLIGLNVLNENTQAIGKLIAIPNFGAGDLLEIKPVSGQSFFVPFQDEFVLNVNIEQNTITVRDADKFQIE